MDLALPAQRIHRLPRFLVRCRTTEVVQQILEDQRAIVPCDCSQLRFALPVGLCLLACACDQMLRRGQKVDLVDLTPEMASFLERMDVLKHCGIEPSASYQRYPHADSLVELRRLDKVSQAPEIAGQLAQAITGILDLENENDSDGMRPPLSERVWFPLQYVLSELLDNALTHGKAHGFKESSVWVAANYYPTTGVVRMAVVDNGCGFLRSLGKHPSVKGNSTDSVAIQAALEPFVSGNPEVGLLDDTSNQGIGLTVSRDIAMAARGYIEVTSGSASLRNTPESTRSHSVPWQGSILDVYMLRSHLLELDIKTHVSQYQQGPLPELRFE